MFTDWNVTFHISPRITQHAPTWACGELVPSFPFILMPSITAVLVIQLLLLLCSLLG